MNTFLRFQQRTTSLGLWLLLVALLSLSLTTEVQATRRYVRQGGTGTGNSWASASGNLQAMINASTSGDQVWVATGTYKPGGNGNTNRAISFNLKNGVTIYGGFAATGNPGLANRNPGSFTTVLSGDLGTPGNNSDNSYHVIDNSENGVNSTAVLDGFVITGGNANSFDGGNQEVGGGMLNVLTSPTLVNCSFVNNTATYQGGAMYNYSSNATLTNCSFRANTSEQYGGVMYNDGGGTITMTNCSFLANTASVNGLIYNYDASATLINCVFFNNGGANSIYEVSASYCLFDALTTGYTDEGHNLTTNISPFISTTSTQLNGCAPAINTGLSSASGLTGITTDLTGNSRVVGSSVDMGAYEYQADPTIVTITNPAVTTATQGSGFSGTFLASGGTGTTSFSLVSGTTLPPGLTLSTTGVLSGTPTQSGSYPITVRATDANGCSGVSTTYTLTVQDTFSPIRYVRQGGTGDGSSWANASADLQSQINLTGVTQVWVAQGTYKPTTTTGPASRNISFLMKNGVTIYGGFAATGSPTLAQRNPGSFTTVLSGDIGTPNDNSDNSYHVVNNNQTGIDNRAVLDGFVITGGNASGDNGTGGGMYNVGTSPTIRNCSFQNNIAQSFGGGMANFGANPTLTNCSFQNNIAQSFGGGMANVGANPSLTNCSFQANTGFSGGGMYNSNGANPSLTNCVLFGNGGGNTLSGTVTLRYSLIEASETGYTDGGNNIPVTVSPFISATSTQLNGCAPAINTGLSSASGLAGITTDLAGNPRVVGSSVDMGAYEYQADPTIVTLTLTNPAITTATAGTPFSQSFTASGGVSPYSFATVSSNLPGTLPLSNAGVLSGTPTQSGSFTLTVRATDANGCSGVSATYTLAVQDAFLPIRYVRQGGTGDGSSWANASADLQSQINLTGVTQVWVAQGTYKPTTGTNRTISFVMKNGVTIYGGFAATGSPTLAERNPTSYTTVLSGDIGTLSNTSDNSYHVVNNDQAGINNTAVLDGFVITGGNANGTGTNNVGGGMINVATSPTVRNCSFQANSTSYNGGGMYNVSSNPSLTNCSFHANSASNNGGGMFNNNSNPSLTNCSFQANSAQAYGGAVYNSNSNNPSLVNCSFQANSAPFGGGMSNNSSNPSLTNCSFQANTGNFGAGMFNSNSNPSLTNCVLFGNGGSNTLTTDSGTVTLRYSLIEASETGYTDGGNNIPVTVSPFASTTSTQLNGFAPAINAGSNAAYNGPGTDLAGNTRVFGGTIDMGAYEYQAAPSAISITNPATTTATLNSPFSGTFTATGGSGSYSFSLVTGMGMLPPGLSLATTGVLSGTPTQAGSFSMTVRATDTNGFSGTTTYTLTVQEPFSPIRYVKQGGSGTGSGNSWANASADLQSQIDLAGVTQVWVAAGMYKPGGDANTNRNISFRMKNDVAIYGGFVGNETILSQRPTINPTTGHPSSSTLSAELGNLATRSDNAFHVINNDRTGITNTAVLDGFVITGAYADETGNNNNAGGGMINESTSPTVRNCSFLSNTASNSGGGMYNMNSNVSLTNCVFLNNTAFDSGGGMHNGAGSNASLINCTFQGNTAINGGGGMQNRDNSNVSLTNCIFQSNAALGVGNGVGFGGAMNNGNSNPSLTNCSFRSNTAQYGGGMYANSSNPVLINCDFQSNSASRLGGSLSVSFMSSLSLTNCSFQSNSATTEGAAVYSDGSCTLTNCVLFGNQAANAIAGYGTVTLRYSLIDASETGYTGSNNLTTTVSPFISPTSTQLNSCAPAINTGSNTAYTTANGPATDLAGNTRVFGGTIDMGAYEYQANPNPALIVTNPTIATATQGSLFSGSFGASGGTSPYIFSLANGATLPAGLTLAATGVLSGTPTQTGIFSLTVSALDALGCSGTNATYTLTVQDAFSPIRYVKQGGAGMGSGNSWANASADLQSQIDLAGVTQVWVAAGTYKPGGNANTDQSVSFSMKNGVAIYGGFANSGSPALVERNPTTFATLLSGDIGTPNDNSDNSFHVISNDGNGLNATAILDGFIITGGNGGDYGGGMYNSGSSPSVANCVFQGNTASEGGGLYNTSSSPVLNNCLFQTNTASVGGGMNNDNSSPTLTRCSFLNNQSDSFGGGMNNFNSSNPTLINCLFQDNSGGFYGGGISNDNSNPSLTNCSFQSNSGGLFGGAIYNSSSNPILTNCSFQANTANEGGAINNQNSSSPVLVNCVLFGNGGANTISGSVSASYSLFEASETDYAGSNNLTTTISPFASTTSTQLNGCAPAINTGNPTAYNGPATDLAGNTRVFGGTIDVGAYEYQAAPNPGLTVTNPTTTTATQGSLFNATFSASGGTSPYSFSLANGSLPTGLTLAATGVLSGTPTQTGIFSFTVSAFDALGCSGTSATYTLNVNAATPTIAGFAATSVSVCTGSPFTFTATIGNVTGSYTYTLTNGVSTTTGATSSLAFNQTLIAVGSGTQSFTLAVEAAGQRTLATTNVTVNAIPDPTLSANFGGTLTCAQTSLTLTANGGTTYAFSGPGESTLGIVSQNPAGGTAVVNAAGKYSVTVTSSGCTATTSIDISQDISFPTFTINPSSATLTCTNPSATLTAKGTGTYLWNTGATSQTITATTIGTYSVTLTGINGCSASTSVSVSADQNAPQLSISPSSATLTCASPTASLTALGTGTVLWSTGSTDRIIPITSAGTYSVTLTSSGGCTATSSVTVSQDNTAPSVSIGASTTALTCTSPSATLTAIGTGSYLWSTGATSQTITATAAGTYSVTLTGINGCSASTSVSVSADQNAPQLSISPSSATLTCASPTASLTALGTGMVLWSTGSTDAQITVNAAGTYSVTLTAPSGCSTSTSITINQDTDLPTVSITPSIGTPAGTTLTCANPTVTLTANGTGTYVWSTGSTSSTVSVSTAGIYSVTLTSENGCSSVASTTVTTDQATPPLSITTSATLLTCASPTASLTALGTGSLRWSTGSTDAQITVSSGGTYSVTLTAPNGCSASTSITLNQDTTIPTVSIASSSTLLNCANPTASLSAIGAGSVRWSTGSTDTQITVNAAGTYSVTLTTPSGCSASTSITINQNSDLPSVGINASSSTITCLSPTVSLTAMGTGDVRWSTGSTNTMILVSEAGLYSVTLTGSNGCSGTTSFSVGQDTSQPTLSITPTSATMSCSTPSVTLIANGTGTYQWSTGATSQTITVTSAGTYSVTLTGANGCTTSASVSITADQNAPALSISPSSSTLTCASPAATLTALGTGSLRWNTGSTEPQITVGTAGTYSVTLTTPGGCTATTSVEVYQDNNLPSVSISPSSVTLTCVNPSALLTAIGTGTYQWSTGASSQTITVTSAGTYSVTLTGGNGCRVSTSITIDQDTNQPAVSISPVSATLSCNNPSIRLMAQGTGTYAWSTGATSQSISASTAGIYSVTLTGANGCKATTSAVIEQAPDQTIGFSQQPSAGTSVTVGATVTTQVVVSGQPTSYQWYKGDLTNPLPAQTSAQLSLTNVQLSDVGSYFIVVSGPCNSLTSTVFNLSVITPVTALTLTASANPNPVQAGQSAMLTATALGGTSPYTYGFTGPGMITPAGNTALVAGLAAGVYSFTVSATDATQPTAKQATTTVSLTVNAVETVPFAITGVTTLACSPITANRFSVSFSPRYSGINGQPISFSVANEMLPTTQPGPYTLQLYTDNATIILQASQPGTPTSASFRYNWLEACRNSESPNTPPRVVSGLPGQTAKVGDYFTYVIPEGTFTDSETPLSLRLSATGLPAGLSFAGATLSGTPSTTVGSPRTVNITATDPGGLSVSTPLILTILPATTPVDPTAPFAITGVTTISCTPIADRININFAPQYVGMNGQPIAFEIVNERAPTTDPAPYSLTLYRDNPVITLRARQTGSSEVANFTYNWLAACSTAGQDNTPPRINSPVASQTATVGKPFNLNLANTFADQETPNQLTLTASGLPAGLVLQGTAISGTPSVSGVSTVVLTATDGGGLTNTTSFALTVNPVSSTTITPPNGFTITGVETVSCVTLSAGLRRVSFQPQYSGLTGQPVSFRVENEMAATTASGPYSLNLYTDNTTIKLKATQQGSAGEASYSYNWLAACSAPARLGTGAEETRLQVTVLGNPVEGEFVELEIRGVAGQLVSAQLLDQQGKSVSLQRIQQASAVERVSLPVGYSRGILLLTVQAATEQHQQKIVVK